MKESSLLLVILAVAEILPGQILNTQERLATVVVFLMIVPVINGTGGNVGCILGSRLTSSLHTGAMKPSLKDEVLKSNAKASFILFIAIYLFIGLLIVLLAFLFGFSMPFGFATAMLVVLGSGVLQALSLIPLTFAVAFYAFKKGWDPDNFVNPVVTTIGDILGTGYLALLVVVIL